MSMKTLKNAQPVCSKLQACRAAGKSNDSNLVTQAWHTVTINGLLVIMPPAHAHKHTPTTRYHTQHEDISESCAFRLYWTLADRIKHTHVEPKRTRMGLLFLYCFWFRLRNEGWTDGLFFNPVCPLLVCVSLLVSICCSNALESRPCHFELLCVSGLPAPSGA